MFWVGVVASCRSAIAGGSGELLLMGLLLRGLLVLFPCPCFSGVGGRGRGGGGASAAHLVVSC